GRQYTYEIVPVTGTPKNLQYGAGVSIAVTTETEAQDEGDGPRHSVYFNRGVIGSQAYARNWKAAPDALQGAERDDACEWLARGLDEAILAYIAQADGPRFGLRAAVYEFDYEPVIAAFKTALDKCDDVQIVYDARVAVSRQGVPDKDQKARVAGVEALLA